jgi:hypothetical protein
VFCEGGAGGMRQEAHDCLGHAAVGGVLEGVVALSEVFPRRAPCAILVRSTIHILTLVHVEFSTISQITRLMASTASGPLSQPHNIVI